MMWVKVKYDKLGRMWPISEHSDKADVKGIRPPFGVIEARDMQEVAGIAAGHNAAILIQLGTVSNPEIVQAGVQQERHGIDPEKISEQGIQIIREYMETGSDAIMGKLMMLHNQEQWSSHQFCCGSQAKYMQGLINELISNHGVQLGLQ